MELAECVSLLQSVKGDADALLSLLRRMALGLVLRQAGVMGDLSNIDLIQSLIAGLLQHVCVKTTKPSGASTDYSRKSVALRNGIIFVLKLLCNAVPSIIHRLFIGCLDHFAECTECMDTAFVLNALCACVHMMVEVGSQTPIYDRVVNWVITASAQHFRNCDRLEGGLQDSREPPLSGPPLPQVQTRSQAQTSVSAGSQEQPGRPTALQLARSSIREKSQGWRTPEAVPHRENKEPGNESRKESDCSFQGELPDFVSHEAESLRSNECYSQLALHLPVD